MNKLDARARAISIERMRLFFRVNATGPFRIVRYLHVLAVLGAASVGTVVSMSSGLGAQPIVMWCSLIFTCEAAITSLNQAFVARKPNDRELLRWAWAKTGLCGLNAGAWSLGPIILHVPSSTISVLAPAWGIVNYMSATVWAGAYFRPSMVAMMTCATLPGAIWLASFRSGAELAVGICLFVSLPFAIAIGWMSSGKTDEAIVTRLEVADLLVEQERQATRIRVMSEERARFFSAASHDLRQPLNAMGFYLALLGRSQITEAPDVIVARLMECADSLERQFDAILGVSDADRLLTGVPTVATPLQRVFDTVSSTLRTEAQRKNLRLRIVETTLWALTRAESLERVVANLVANAIKYTPTGSILLGARRTGEDIAISVVDTGIGIAPGDQTRIFDDFVQLDNAERNRDKGIGIGLAIVRRICDAAGWRIALTSRPGFGSTFTVVVPRAPAAAPGEAAISAAPQQPNITRAGQVIVVDDDTLVRDSLRQLLGSWGFDAHLFETGAQALSFMGANRFPEPVSVLLDYRLPGEENGIDIADRLVEELTMELRIIIMTGDLDNALDDAARARCITILRKPVRPVRLRAALTAPQMVSAGA